MKFTIKSIVKKISNLPEEIKFKRLKEHSSSPDFTEYHELAECYHKGIGTKRNYKQALKWYIKEAEAGNAEAQYDLGMRYWKGEKLVGGVQNEDETLRWMEIAAEGGHKKAIKFIEDYEEKNPAKLEHKIVTFTFDNIKNTLTFAKKIQQHSLYMSFLQNAIMSYGQNKDGKAILSLADLISDDKSILNLLIDYAEIEIVLDRIKDIEEKNRENIEGQLMLADVYEKHCKYDKAFDILSISANDIKHSSTAEFIAFVQRLCTMYESMGDYDKVLEIINEASYKCVDFSKTTIREEFVKRYAHKHIVAGKYVKAMKLLEDLKLHGKDVSAEISNIEEYYVNEVITDANAYESYGDYVKASHIYQKIRRFKSGVKAHGAFLVRWAKHFEEQSELLDAREMLLAARNNGCDVMEDLQRVEQAMKQKYGKDYSQVLYIRDIEDFQELYDLISLMDNPVLGEVYKTKAIELFENYLNTADCIENLEEYNNFAIELGMEVAYKERIKDLIRVQIGETDDFYDLADIEDIASKHGLGDLLQKKKKEICVGLINDCDDLDELEDVKDYAYELGLKEEYDSKAFDLGANIEERIDGVSDLEDLAEIEELAYNLGKKDLFLKKLEYIISDCYDLSFTDCYKLFSEDESKEVFVKIIENNIDGIEYERFFPDGVSLSIVESDIDEDLWSDLSEDYRSILKYLEFYHAIIDRDLETALEAYNSPDFVDLEKFTGNGPEYELEYLYEDYYNKAGKKFSFVELYEKYGNGWETFLGQDVSEKYCEEARELEGSGDIETAVRYYIEAEERGNVYAKNRLIELYEDE